MTLFEKLSDLLDSKQGNFYLFLFMFVFSVFGGSGFFFIFKGSDKAFFCKDLINIILIFALVSCYISAMFISFSGIFLIAKNSKKDKGK